MATDYPAFRRDLDTTLRQQDPARLREFLIARGQWRADTPTDPERAMWLMIAASPNLRDLHAAARAWLEEHGHGSEAAAVMNHPATGAKRAQKPQRPRKQTTPRRP
jgi:hypothetical protein